MIIVHLVYLCSVAKGVSVLDIRCITLSSATCNDYSYLACLCSEAKGVSVQDIRCITFSSATCSDYSLFSMFMKSG